MKHSEEQTVPPQTAKGCVGYLLKSLKYLERKPALVFAPGISGIFNRYSTDISTDFNSPSDIFLIHIGLLCRNTLRLIHFQHIVCWDQNWSRGPSRNAEVCLFFFFPGPPQVPHMLRWSGHTGLPPIKQADFSQKIRDRLYSEGALNRATGYHRGGMSSFSVASAWLAYFVHCLRHRKRASSSATCFKPAGCSLNHSRSFFPLNYLHSISGKPVTNAPCRCWRLS